MKIQKVIKCGIIGLTRIKERLLSEEYENLQRFLRGEKDVKLYSANKQQAKRFYKKIKKDKEYPLSIRKDLNGAINIGNRLFGYILKSEGRSEPAQTPPENSIPKGNVMAIQYARGEALSVRVG